MVIIVISYSDLSEHNIERSSCQLLATRFVTYKGLTVVII